MLGGASSKKAASHEDCLPRRRPGGPLFRDQHEAARRRATTSPCSSATGRTIRSAGAWCSPTRPSTTSPPTIRSAPRRSAPTSPIGTTSRCIIAASGSYRAATAFPASRARSCSCCCSSARASSASTLRFQTEIASAGDLAKDYDLVVAADGLNSRTRAEFADYFKPAIDTRKNKFVWLGTNQKFDDAFTFIFEETEHGWIWAHAYQFDADTATFIVECSEATWEKFGFGAMSQDENCRTCERIFAKYLGGHRLMSNAAHIRGSAWLNFPRVLCEKWSHRNIVLMGDAAATAHFSIGSGTKLAMESAVSMANYLHSEPTMQAAFAKYEDARRTEVLRLQSAARNSMEWFEDVERYLHLDPVQFNYSLLTRSQRISHENLRLRDKNWLEGAEAWFQRLAGAGDNTVRRPMFAPFKLRGMRLKNRVVVSPMAQYKAVDGCPTDWHLVHYGERAKGGAGLVCIEMTCVSPEGRITPGCTGMYAPEHEAAWKRIVDFVHCRNRRENLLPARPFRRQGLDPARLGGNGRAAQRRQLAGHVGVGDGVVGTQPARPRHGSRRHGSRARPIRRRGQDGGSAPTSTCSKSIARTAICCPPSSRR